MMLFFFPISALHLGDEEVTGQIKVEGHFPHFAENLSKFNFQHRRGENGAGTSEEGVRSGLGSV